MIMKAAEGQENSFYLKYHYVLTEIYFVILLFYPVYLSCRGLVQIVLILSVLLAALLWAVDKYYPHCKFIGLLRALEKSLTPQKLSWYVILGYGLFIVTLFMRDYMSINIWLEVLKNVAIWLFILWGQFRKKTH